MNGKMPQLAIRESSLMIQAQSWEALLGKVHFEKFLNLKDFYGCPDRKDGGEEWLEISQNARSKRVTFEYGRDPEEQ